MLGCDRESTTQTEISAAGSGREAEKPPAEAVSQTPSTNDAPERRFVSLNESEMDELRPAVTKFCADCHAMPRASSSRRDDWVEEVDQGFMLYKKAPPL